MNLVLNYRRLSPNFVLFVCSLSFIHAGAQDSTLLDLAAGHVRIAEEHRGDRQLWGRIAGSEAERASARLLAEQLRPFVDRVELEPFSFRTPRPERWVVQIDGAGIAMSAMPAPFDGRFPEGPVSGALHAIETDTDWENVHGKWAFIQANMPWSPASTSVRDELLYQRAVEAGAAGFIFALPTPPGHWPAVVPVDKPFAVEDERYADGRRPIPCFSVDRDEGVKIAAAAAAGRRMASSIRYRPDDPLAALNTVGELRGGGEMTVILVAHLDAFFSGAVDDAGGLAVMVGLAERLQRIPREERPADFLFLGVSGHHDQAVGMRAFIARDPARMTNVDQYILLEHLDAQTGDEPNAQWRTPLNDFRRAYLGDNGWPEVRAALPGLVVKHGLMTRAAPMVDACIADMYVVCDDVKGFSLIQSPPYYHTTHDTMDKLSEAGLQKAVEFHLELLQVTGALAPAP